MKKCIFLIFGIIGLISFPNAYSKHLGDWDGSSKHMEGWSEWSLKDEHPNSSVRRAIYIPVESWGGRTENKDKYDHPVTTCTVDNPNSYCELWKPDGVDRLYFQRSGQLIGKKCTNFREKNGKTGCNCALANGKDGRPNLPTDYCARPGTPESHCGGNGSQICDKVYTQQCFWYWCGEWQDQYEDRCNGDGGSNDRGCGVKSTKYYAKRVNTFKDPNNKSNWNTSVSNAGGYAKITYIYSYPLDFYINFNGNGANGTCDFKPGSNNFSNANNIAYNLGNQFCQSAEQSGGTMPKQTISYVNGGKLNHNKS